METLPNHESFSTYTDGSQVRMTCETCNVGHTFASNYFAKSWANQHSTGREYGRTPIGLA